MFEVNTQAAVVPAAVASFRPADVAALSPDARTAFIAQMTKVGYEQTAIDRALALGDESTAPQAAPSAQAIDGTRTVLPREQERALGLNLITHWTGDRAELEAGLKAAGMDDLLDPAGEDTRSAEAREFDAHLDGAEPADFDLNGLYVNRSGVDASDIDRNLRQALAEMRMPIVMAKGIASQLLDNFGLWAGLNTDAERTLYWTSEQLAAERTMHKPYSEVIRLARIAVDRIDRQVAQDLAQRGAFDSAAVIMNLARQGERLAARAAMAERSRAASL